MSLVLALRIKSLAFASDYVSLTLTLLSTTTTITNVTDLFIIIIIIIIHEFHGDTSLKQNFKTVNLAIISCARDKDVNSIRHFSALYSTFELH